MLKKGDKVTFEGIETNVSPTRSLNESRTAIHDNDLTGRIVLPH